MSEAVEAARGVVEVALNLWWSWEPTAQALFRALEPGVHEGSLHNPVAVLRAVSGVGQGEWPPHALLDPADRLSVEAIAGALEAKGLVGQAQEVVARFRAYMDGGASAWAKGAGGVTARVAYFSMEFALHASLPIYSGGLGVLAGDHLKAASDLGLSFSAVGLFYHEGYFFQRLEADGAQVAQYPEQDPANLALRLERDAHGQPVMVEVSVGVEAVRACVRRVDVGRIKLYLLDTCVPGNSERAVALTRRLYSGDDAMRIDQEILVGVGGVRALRALGVAPQVWHLNEGHCAFLTLELLRERVAGGESFEAARAQVARRCVFTTHTPVPAGHDRFWRGLVAEHLGWMADALGIGVEALMDLGRANPTAGALRLDLPEPGQEGSHEAHKGAAEAVQVMVEAARRATEGQAPPSDEPLCMTVLALRLSKRANGVSMLHGEVSRQMWSGMWPDRAASDVPIGHVTNGIHLPTWMSPIARAHLAPHLPSGWEARHDEPELWLDAVERMSDAQLWGMRQALKGELMRFVQARHEGRSARLEASGQPRPAPMQWRADALTLGFARRFATYKRATLIFDDLARARRLLGDPERPLQIVFAGKAHPRDVGGQEVIRELVQMSQAEGFAGKVIVLEDYDMIVGQGLVSGVDVWLNNPRRPREASGTSGQKVAVHAGLNLSLQDGWWPEGYDGVNGFAIGDATPPVEPHEQDARDSAALYDALEGQVLPLYYGDRGEDGVPRRWVRRIRAAMGSLVWRFTTQRMVKDYATQFYGPSAVGAP
jgi:glucan phosphorylase